MSAAPNSPKCPYDAVVVVSFGGPESPEDVMPFLRRVTSGRNVPAERLQAVAEHYYAHCGSPINGQNRKLVEKLRERLCAAGLDLPVYWGNRNWHPFLVEAVEEMARDGVRRALAFVTSAFGSYSGCRQYQEDIAAACSQVADAPSIHKLRLFNNHPGFIEPMTEGVVGALQELSSGAVRPDGAHPDDAGRPDGAQHPVGAHPPDDAGRPVEAQHPVGAQTRLVFSAHSIPSNMAAAAPYEAQLREAAGLIAGRVAEEELPWDLVYQSRSGDHRSPWLEPDVCDHLRGLPTSGVRSVVLTPLGFVSDHMEVIHDLDTEAAAVAASVGLRLLRSPTVGTHPAFVEMIVELALERIEDRQPRWLGASGAWPDNCQANCCYYLPGAGRPRRPGPHPTSTATA